MRDFLAATYGVITSNAAVTAVIGSRLYENDAPQKPVFPYAVYVKVSNSSVMRGIQQIRYQVNVIDDRKNSERVLIALDALEAALTAQRYGVNGSSNAVVLKRGEKVDQEVLNDEGESLGWSGVIDFDILYSK